MTTAVARAESAPLATQVRRRAKRRRQHVLAALSIAALGAFFTDVLLGWYTVSFADLVRILAGASVPGADFLIVEHRLPRAVIGALVGSAFGISGTIFQTVLGNPLASPDIIGVTAGASTSAVFAIVILGWSGALVSVAACGGTLAVAAAVYVLSHRPGAAGERLVVTGVAVAALAYALTSHLLTRADIWTASEALLWLNGSLNNSTWSRVLHLAVALGLLLPATALAASRMTPLELGDDTAAALGVRVARSRAALLLAGVALTGVATAAAGPVAFVSFLAGLIGRRLVHGRTSLAVAALVGAIMVLASDFVSVNLIPGVALPVGVVTGALGAPFLLCMLVTANRLER